MYKILPGQKAEHVKAALLFVKTGVTSVWLSRGSLCGFENQSEGSESKRAMQNQNDDSRLALSCAAVLLWRRTRSLLPPRDE